MSILLPNHSATLWILCENFRSCEGEFGTRVPLRSTGAPFRSCETLRSGKAQISQQKSHSAGYFAIAKAILAHSAPFSQLFISFLEPHRASLRSSSPIISSGQISATRNGANQRGQVFLSFKPQESCERSQFQIPFLSLRSQSNSSSGEARAAKASGERYLTRSGGRPLQKRPRVESSEPIDLTEQSPEPFAGSNSSSLADSCHSSGAISGAASKPRSLSRHFPSPKFHLK
ncbi:hypothetical protein CK203_089794 [Vitis vinifera]|uniref:Uncharacterized protein n=1 Tax=Vitis vinifera TaxID=29760 RepID=A0A438BLC0_VITVI|nr:hypothetical protein CK203_089794 [Vitis vinifera]